MNKLTQSLSQGRGLVPGRRSYKINLVINIEALPIPPQFDRYSKHSELIKASKDKPMRGYPAPEDRWCVSAEEWEEIEATGIVPIPEGPWNVTDHPDRQKAAAAGIPLDPAVVTPDTPIDPARTAEWKKKFKVTTLGLPVHPLTELVTTELPDGARLRMATGIGRERYYGPLNICNAAVARENEDDELEYAVVTTIRDGKKWISFPGGYVELSQTIAEGGVSELNQETGLVDACEKAGISWSDIEQQPHVLWALSPSVTGPCTVNAWLAEHFFMIDASGIEDIRGITLKTQDPDEIKAVEWRSWRKLLSERALMKAHRRALLAHVVLLGLRDRGRCI